MLKANKCRKEREGYKVTPRMKIPCVLCGDSMTDPKSLSQVQKKNFEEYDKEESPLTKNHLLAYEISCCRHLMCIKHVPKTSTIFNCPFCLVPHYSPDLLNEFKWKPGEDRIHTSVTNYHRFNKEPDCNGCLICPRTGHGSLIVPALSVIRDKWMKLFFHRTISFRQLDEDNKKIVNFLYNEGLLLWDREINEFAVYMHNEDQFFADTHRTLDQTLARWIVVGEIARTCFSSVIAPIWPVLHDDNLFRHITSFL